MNGNSTSVRLELNPPPPFSEADTAVLKWTVGAVFASLGIFLLAGLAEIGGGWLVWQAVRNGKPWYYALAGKASLLCKNLKLNSVLVN